MLDCICASLVLLNMTNGIENHEENSSGYFLEHIKGTARGSMGKFESNSMLELKREKLKKKNAKF